MGKYIGDGIGKDTDEDRDRRSFAKILEQWESSQEKRREEKARRKQVAERPYADHSVPSVPKRRFSDIYYAWEKTHDESCEIHKRAKTSEPCSTEHNNLNEATINQLRRMEAQDELDLHEMKLEEAKVATRQFIDRSFDRGYRKVRIITGKGLHSKGGEAILRPAVSEVCKRHPRVREVSVPKASDGGSGALAVILKAH